MIDLETFGNSPNAVIIQIGACKFDRVTGEVGEMFNINVNAESGLKEGFEVQASTIYWWLEQSKAARESVSSDLKWNVRKAMGSLNFFIDDCKCVWSHSTFDFVIMMNHFRKLDIEPNVSFRAARDIRTVVDLANINVNSYERVGVAHDALSDCLFQVKYVVDCLNTLVK